MRSCLPIHMLLLCRNVGLQHISDLSRTLKRTAISLSMILAVAVPMLSRAQKPGLPANFDAYVAHALKEFDTPGLAIAVVKDGQVVLVKGYGVKRLGDPAPVDAHTLFQIASNTKAFTAAALGILVDQGKLQWDDRVTQFIPDFQLSNPYVTREFTVRDMLTHRSGLGLGAGDLLWFHSNYSRHEIVRRIRAAKFVSGFRAAYAYDNVMYIAAGEIFPAVTGKSWEAFMQEQLLTPLGMTGSTTGVEAVPTGADAATPHGRAADGHVEIVPVDSVDATAPAGGINASVSDLSKWLVPSEKLGVVVLTNMESALADALCQRVVDAYLGAPPTDWAAAIAAFERQQDSVGKATQQAQSAARAADSKPSLPLAKYTGHYTDALYGDATITDEGDHLVLRFSHSPAFTGDLEHWQYDTFVAHWRARHVEDAFVTFALTPQGAVESMKMAAVSPLADFSFDFQDLFFMPTLEDHAGTQMSH